MRGTSKMDNLNCKTQPHTRVCEEKIIRKTMPINIETILWLKKQVLRIIQEEWGGVLRRYSQE